MQRERIHHIGIVMMSRAQAEEFMDIFGFEIDKEEYVDVYNAQCIFTKVLPNETAIEFIIPDKGVLCDYNNGRGGIHHIALQVDDVAAVTKEYTEKGREMLEKAPVQGACGIIVNFMRPKFGAGILVEFIERTRPDSV